MGSIIYTEHTRHWGSHNSEGNRDREGNSTEHKTDIIADTSGQ